MGIIVNIILIISACAVAALLKQAGKPSATKTAQQPIPTADTNATSSIDSSGRRPLTIAELLNQMAENTTASTIVDEPQVVIQPADDKTTPKKAVDSPKIDSKTLAEDEFDLAKAVVYSEILTPKFKDEDF